MTSILNIPLGCCTIFALMNVDKDKYNIKIGIDEGISEDGYINFHPLVNSRTLTLKYEDMIKFIESQETEFLYF